MSSRDEGKSENNSMHIEGPDVGSIQGKSEEPSVVPAGGDPTDGSAIKGVGRLRVVIR